MNAANPIRNVVDLASDAMGKAADLVQLEFRLARAEIAEKLEAWRAGLALVLVGAIFATAALFLLLQAAVVALVERGLKPSAATLIVAIASLIVAAILMGIGRSRLGAQALKPERTIDQLSRDRILVKEKLT
ncbi:Putative Holin-X, holin superfamily III [Enhydrobacter aerosaccus]|uniref:Putative Holin-X, holin superfamily III n=1 Tax=Enhydrobacter aerosaccus TaxID=225324 RepID=A0A1T4QCT3_9HYPH|nr:phage holin family protein [Enhydrobacter aerosaccus]SKA01495.1 Putative Holin-X, holin superfamily III [Enhydrobacter aerosaccus]